MPDLLTSTNDLLEIQPFKSANDLKNGILKCVDSTFNAINSIYSKYIASKEAINNLYNIATDQKVNLADKKSLTNFCIVINDFTKIIEKYNKEVSKKPYTSKVFQPAINGNVLGGLLSECFKNNTSLLQNLTVLSTHDAIKVLSEEFKSILKKMDNHMSHFPININNMPCSVGQPVTPVFEEKVITYLCRY